MTYGNPVFRAVDKLHGFGYRCVLNHIGRAAVVFCFRIASLKTGGHFSSYGLCSDIPPVFGFDLRSI
jgi:hypothetical protein